MTKATMTLAALLLAACGSDNSAGPEAPSCQQGYTHYYDAGCGFRDNNGPIPVTTMIDLCRQDINNLPTCRDEIDTYLLCLDEVPLGATTDAQCDCSQEQEALLACG